jgi:YD repeat-containing protein
VQSTHNLENEGKQGAAQEYTKTQRRPFASFQRGAVSIMRLFAILISFTLLALSLPSSAGQERYDYDPLGRLIRFVNSSGEVTEYNYDAAGNITSVVRGGSAAAYVPSITGITPNFVRRGETSRIGAIQDGLAERLRRVGSLVRISFM